MVFADSLLSGLQRVFLSAGNAADHILNIALVEVFWLLAFVIWHIYDDTELLASLKMLLRSFVILNCPSFYWENVDYIRDGDKYHFQQQDV